MPDGGSGRLLWTVSPRVRTSFVPPLATTGSKSAISASSLAQGSTPWSLRWEQYGLVTASYSIEFVGSQRSFLRAVRLTAGDAIMAHTRRGNAPHIPNEADA